ncbi:MULTISPECIES: hypothetical protein [unclassified Paraflavitalea]|uniref:hypothetical protein n=1 Tax=unclassified Paraflavitalea TaxID=2798305 RepID=UPI003D3427FE
MKRVVYLILLSLWACPISAQSLQGAWYGKAEVNSGNSISNYLVEMHLVQRGESVTGTLGYYFKDTYQSFFIRGEYDKTTRQIQLDEFPVLHYSSTSSAAGECAMRFVGTLMVSQVNSLIRGYFVSDARYKYTCPELKVKLTLNTDESREPEAEWASSIKKIWKPQDEETVVNTTPTPSETTAVPLKKPEQSEEIRALISNLRSRTNIYSREIEVYGDSVKISFYDNGDIDGDSITVFVNQQPVLIKREISTRALNLYLVFDDRHPVQEITMMAENLGTNPPNTALMIITDGSLRYEEFLSSNLSQNAVVRIRKKISRETISPALRK